jgi:hypothetical protein
MPSLCDHDHASLAAEFVRLGLPAVHARAVLRSFYAAGGGAADLTSRKVGKGVAAGSLPNPPPRLGRRRTHACDGTTKLLVR